ncbi:MAG: DNA cytosine methyltransferase [Anaerolineae bacterium]
MDVERPNMEQAEPRDMGGVHSPTSGFTAIDLFCGCGGLTQGLRDAGFCVLGAVDIDPLCIQTYRANHPQVRLWQADIRNLDPLGVVAELGLIGRKLDLIAGCPPCQGFSRMRTRNGTRCADDPRNDLLREFETFVAVLLPRAIMLENVPGLGGDARFHSFLRHLGDLGYVGEPKCLDAADFGVPQRRRRLIYLAGLGFSIPSVDKATVRSTIESAIRWLPKAGASGDPLHDIPERRSQRILDLIGRIPRDGGSRTDLPPEDQLLCHRRCDGFKDVYGRMAWKDVSPTITGGCFNPSKGRFLHPEEDRAITMREASLLQGFPSDYRFPNRSSKSALALMIGNALPPPFIAAHGKSLRDALQGLRTHHSQCEDSNHDNR